MTTFKTDPLASHHDRDTFACGETSLDNYLKRQASKDVKRDLTACYVLTEEGASSIIGYYTLNAASVEITDLPPDVAKNSGRYPLVPAILIGRLAVDQRYRGKGMGELLLFNALRRILRTGIGAKVVVVAALHDQAAQFYERYQFRRFEDTSLRLYLSVSHVRKMFPGDAGIQADSPL